MSAGGVEAAGGTAEWRGEVYAAAPVDEERELDPVGASASASSAGAAARVEVGADVTSWPAFSCVTSPPEDWEEEDEDVVDLHGEQASEAGGSEWINE